MQRAHGQLEAAAATLGPPRKVTLKDFLLDPLGPTGTLSGSTFEPPMVEYTVEESDGVHRARVPLAGVSHAGAPASSQEEARLSAALVALRSLRAKHRNGEKHGHQVKRFVSEGPVQRKVHRPVGGDIVNNCLRLELRRRSTEGTTETVVVCASLVSWGDDGEWEYGAHGEEDHDEESVLKHGDGLRLVGGSGANHMVACDTALFIVNFNTYTGL
ncbi:unnamed protein product [Symbiodinium sp. CCMP2456]|nr:unnamed protein product [Symbiodinium sp. CCMP2456]